MQAPKAATIEGAADTLQKIQKDPPAPKKGATSQVPPPPYPQLTESFLNSELRELDAAIGQEQVIKLKALLLPKPSNLPHAFRVGYLLGLQAARLSLRLPESDVNPSDVL